MQLQISQNALRLDAASGPVLRCGEAFPMLYIGRGRSTSTCTAAISSSRTTSLSAGRRALCLETEFWPDGVHFPAFPQPAFDAGEPYRAETVYRFSPL